MVAGPTGEDEIAGIKFAPQDPVIEGSGGCAQVAPPDCNPTKPPLASILRTRPSLRYLRGCHEENHSEEARREDEASKARQGQTLIARAAHTSGVSGRPLGSFSFAAHEIAPLVADAPDRRRGSTEAVMRDTRTRASQRGSFVLLHSARSPARAFKFRQG